MNLLEFISFCTIKGTVLEHKKLDPGGKPTHICDYYQVHIQARAYTAKLEYARVDDWTKVIQSTLQDHGRIKTTNYKPTFKQITKAILG
jgi:hypothetical protein